MTTDIITKIQNLLDECYAMACEEGCDGDQDQYSYTGADLDYVTDTLGYRPTAEQWRAAGLKWVGEAHVGTVEDQQQPPTEGQTMTSSTNPIVNAVMTVVAFMRSHRAKTIGEVYDQPRFPVGALRLALPGYEYPEISGLSARQLRRRALRTDRAAGLVVTIEDQHVQPEPACEHAPAGDQQQAALVQLADRLRRCAIADLQGEQRWLKAAIEEPQRATEHRQSAMFLAGRASGWQRAAEEVDLLISR